MRQNRANTVLLAILSVAAMVMAACGPATTHITATTSPSYLYHIPAKKGGTITVGGLYRTDSSNLVKNVLDQGTAADERLDDALYGRCLIELPDLSLLDKRWQMDQCISIDESANSTTTMLHFDPLAKWSDGTPVTSQDYRLWYDVATDQNIGGYKGAAPWNAATIAFPDQYTATINWHQPYSAWRIAIAGLYALPAQQYRDSFEPTKYSGSELGASTIDPGYHDDVMLADLGYSGSNANTHADTLQPITNGPYMLKSYMSDGTMTLMVPNPYYHSNYFHQSVLDHLIYEAVPNATTLIADFAHGQFDHVEDLTASAIPQLYGIPNDEIVETPSLAFEHLDFDQYDNAPNALATADHQSIFAGAQGANIRKAFIEGWDKCDAMRALLGKTCNDPMYQTQELTVPLDPAYDNHTMAAAYDPADANRLLDSAGFTRGANGLRLYPGTTTPVTIKISYKQADPLVDALGTLIRNELSQNLGITMDVAQPIYCTFNGVCPFADMRINATSTASAVGIDPSATSTGDQSTLFIDPTLAMPEFITANQMGVQDPQIQNWLQQARVTVDATQQVAIYRQLYDYLAQQSIAEGLFDLSNITLTDMNLGNYAQALVQGGNLWNASNWYAVNE